MSAYWGTQTLHARVLVLIVLAIPLVGCQYSGEEEMLSNSPFPNATAQPRSFQETIDDVARLLEVSEDAPGMPSEANPAGELTMDLVPGDYEIKAACAGVLSAEITLVRAGGQPEVMQWPCDTTAMKRFERHAGGPLTVRATPFPGDVAVAGVAVGQNSNLDAPRSKDLLEWSRQKLKPELPGEVFGAGESNTAISYGSGEPAAPGKYELHFLCEGPSAGRTVGVGLGWRRSSRPHTGAVQWGCL